MIDMGAAMEVLVRRAYDGIALARRLWHTYPPEAVAREAAAAARRQDEAANAAIMTANQLAASARGAAALFDNKGRRHG